MEQQEILPPRGFALLVQETRRNPTRVCTYQYVGYRNLVQPIHVITEKFGWRTGEFLYMNAYIHNKFINDSIHIHLIGVKV